MIATSAAVGATLTQALRVLIGAWGRDFQREARAPARALERIGHRLERFKATGLNPDNGLLISAASLVNANPLLVAQRLHAALTATITDALVHGPHPQAPERVQQAVEQEWPRIVDRLVRELLRESRAR